MKGNKLRARIPKAIIILLVVVGLIGGGWLVWQSMNKNDSGTPMQNIQSSTGQSTQAGRQASTPQRVNIMLFLRDFNAKIPLSSKTTGIMLGTVNTSSYNAADKFLPLIVSQLDSGWKCEADPDGNFKGTIGNISVTTGAKRSGPGEPLVSKKVGNYTFGFEQGGSKCTDSADYQQLVDAFKTQFELISTL